MDLFNLPFFRSYEAELGWLISRVKNVETSEANAKASEEAANASATLAEASATHAEASAAAAATSAEASATSADSISRITDQVNVNTGRIDSLVANAGDTDNNAELLDIRTGWNGEIYPTAGSAVRSISPTIINKSTRDALQNGLFNTVTPPMHVGTWKESTHEFGPSTSRVVFDATQQYTGTERIYVFDDSIDIFIVAFNSSNEQTGYVGWILNEDYTPAGYYDLPKFDGAINSTTAYYLLIFRFRDNRTITDVSQISNNVMIVTDYKENVKETLVMVSNLISGKTFNIYKDTGRVEIYGNIFIYTPHNDKYYNLYCDTVKTFNLSHGQTLVIDLSAITPGVAYAEDNSAALKVVTYGNYSEQCLPIANMRNDTLAVTGPFAQFIVSNTDFNRNSYKLEEFKSKWYPFTMHNTGAGWSSRVNLLHISDTHIGTTDAYNNLVESIQAGNSMAGENVLGAVINTGDSTNGGDLSLTDFMLQYNRNTAAISMSTAPYMMLLGNHDANNALSTVTEVPSNLDLFPPFQNIYNQQGVTAGDAAAHKRYYYFDKTQGGHNVRVIMLDQLDHPDYNGANTNYQCQWNAVYSQDQIDWLVNTALNVPANYGVIIANHFPFAPYREQGYSETWPALNDGTFAQGWTMIPEIVHAWQNRTSLSKTFTDTIGSQDIVVNANFAAVPVTAEFICYLTGHTHSKNVYNVAQEGGVSFNQVMMCEDSSGQNGVALSRSYKHFGTISDNAFSCISIDMDERKIYRTSFGVYEDCNNVETQQTQVFTY